MNNLAENPPSTSPLLMDGKWVKLLAIITEPKPDGIKRVKSVTSPNFVEDISCLANDYLR